MTEEREGGFIVIHRRIESWPLWPLLRADQRWVVTQLILMANWKDTTIWTLRGEQIDVKRGQLVASEYAIAERANCGRQVVRTVFALLEREGFLTRVPAISNPQPNPKSARVPFIVTITNYSRFQTVKDDGGEWANPQAKLKPTQGQPKPNLEPTRSEQVEPVNQVTSSDEPAARAKGSDPRKGEKRTAFERVFREVRGTAYYWQGPKDWQAVSRLVAVPLAEWEARARLGLQSTDYARRVDSVAQLGMKWNALAGAAPQSQRVIGGAGKWDDPENLKW